MKGKEFSKTQIKRGIVIIATFILLRALLAKLWRDYFGLDYEISLQFVFFLISVFLAASVGLVYIGFTEWIGIDLKKSWYDRKRILGDMGWGILGFVIAFVLILVMTMIATTLGFAPAQMPTTQLSPIQYLLSLFFGFAIAAFQEETIFRGFLQDILAERFGNWQGNILQAAMFSIAHVGYYPLSLGYMFIIAFVSGIVFGWLKMKRGTLIVPAIAHGLMG